MILIETEDRVQRMATRGQVSCPASFYLTRPHDRHIIFEAWNNTYQMFKRSI